MKHFIVGPVEMYPETKAVYNKEHTYFRTKEFGEFVKYNLAGLQKLLNNNAKDSIIYLTMSGTGAMEAVVENCTNQNDKVLVINGGTFGKRFFDLLKFHNIKTDEIKLEWCEELTQKHFSSFENKGYTMLFVNLHETSSGQLYDIELISDFCKRNNAMLVVDAISTFLCDEYDMKKYSIDTSIISSQKGLCLSAGLSFVSMSKRMLEKVKNAKTPTTKYFDFKDYLKNIERGQTPYTPANLIMYELNAILDLIEKSGGKKKWLLNIEEKCNYFRELAKNSGFIIPSYKKSNMLTPIYFENINAVEIVNKLKDDYQLYVNPCGGELSDKLLRVSHIGNTTKEDFKNLIEKMQIVTEKLKTGSLT